MQARDFSGRVDRAHLTLVLATGERAKDRAEHDRRVLLDDLKRHRAAMQKLLADASSPWLQEYAAAEIGRINQYTRRLELP